MTQDRELRSERPRTIPMNRWTHGSSLSISQARPTVVGVQSTAGFTEGRPLATSW